MGLKIVIPIEYQRVKNISLTAMPLKGVGGCKTSFMPTNKIIPYNSRLKALARELRKNSTLAEVLLWQNTSDALT